MKIHGMMLVRNEESKRINGICVLKEVLEQLNYLCDTITIIDDNSTDKTVDYIRGKVSYHKLKIIENKKRKWNTNEVEVRKQLWEETISRADDNDWIICLDADELFVNEHLDYVSYLAGSLSKQIDGIAFRLHDMWNFKQYRHDNYWKAHIYPWPFMVRYKKDFKYMWNNRRLHCGRFPQNSSKAALPTQIPVRHLGWADEELRKEKYKRYMETDPHGIYGIMEQYQSILDPNPNLIEFGRCCVE